MTWADPVSLRTAGSADVEAGGELHRTCWAETYASIADPAALEPRLADRGRWTESWRRGLATGPPRLLAVERHRDGREVLVGFAIAGPARDQGGEPAPTPHELHALYVRRSRHGTGLGSRLLRAALDPLPPGAVMLWVSEDNTRARAFYERHGFVDDDPVAAGRQLYAGLGAWEVRLVRRSAQRLEQGAPPAP